MRLVDSTKDLVSEVTKTTTYALASFADAVYDALPSDPRVLAFAARAGHVFSVERALEWSARLREVGLDEHCPLLNKASDATEDALTRVRAAASRSQPFRILGANRRFVTLRDYSTSKTSSQC